MKTLTYVDDEIDTDRVLRLKQRFEEDGVFVCNLEYPPTNIAEVQALAGDALLVDFDLATAIGKTGVLISYHGNTAATEVRVTDRSRPIVLVSTANLLSSWKSNRNDVSDTDVDLILFKDEVLDDPKNAQAKLFALIEGFASLNSINGSLWNAVAEKMNATKDEAALLREAVPPIDDGKWTVPKMSKWIRNVVMRYPGILYDDLYCATKLGIDVSSFNLPEVQQLFVSTKYDGIFSGFGRRWWVRRVLAKAGELLLEQEIQGPISIYFAKAFEDKYAIALSRSKCIWDKTEGADQVCFVLRQPVKLINSIAYYPDRRPAVMDRARVSRRAMSESNDFQVEYADPDSYEAVREDWNLEE